MVMMVGSKVAELSSRLPCSSGLPLFLQQQQQQQQGMLAGSALAAAAAARQLGQSGRAMGSIVKDVGQQVRRDGAVFVGCNG
jgi:hypothetical protein